MAAISNEIDRILQAAATRLSNPANAAVLLTASTSSFHVAAGGANDPASISFTASLIALEGPIVFACTGGTLTVVGNVATLTYSNMPGQSASVSASVTANGATVTSNPCFVTKIIDGAGVANYTWVKYGTSSVGAGLTDNPDGMAYIGLAYNKSSATESTNPADYAWSLIRGTDGTAVKGDPGADGQTFYTWIKYADVADGTGLYDTPTESTLYLGLAVNKTSSIESTTKTDYVWSRFKGGDGVPGGTGATGARGAGHFYAVGSSWSDIAANVATPGENVIDDVVTISNGSTFVMEKKWTGSAWVLNAVVIDGNLLVPGSITTSKLNTSGLEVRAPDGTLILSSGGLAAGYEAAGTKNADLAPSIAAAATTATTAGLNAGVGINRLANSIPNNVLGLSFYKSHSQTVDTNAVQFIPKGYVYDVYSPLRQCVLLRNPGVGVDGQTIDLILNASAKQAVTAGQRYEFAVYASAHRCYSQARIAWYNNAGGDVGQSIGDLSGFNDQMGYDQPGGFPRRGVFAVAPPGAAYAMCFVRMHEASGQSDLYLFVSGFYFSEALPAQTVFTPWADGAPQDVRAIGYTGDLNASTGALPGSLVNGIPVATVTTGAANGATALADVLNMFADNKLTPDEKKDLKQRWAAIGVEDDSYYAQASALGVSTAGYTAAIDALAAYLNSIPGGWDNLAVTSTVVRADGEAAWKAYDAARSNLQNAIASKIQVNAAAAQSSADTANNALNNGSTGLPAMLKKAGDNITGTIGLTSTYAILVGTANDGIFLGSTGLYGRKAGFTTFSIANDGTALFGGTLVAATGTFGAVTIAAGGSISSGQTAYNTGTGWHLSFIGGVPKMSIGNPGGNRLTFDGSVMEYVGTIQLPPFSVSITGTLDDTQASTTNTTSVGTLTASVTGGRAPFTYLWVGNVSETNPETRTGVFSLSAPTSSTTGANAKVSAGNSSVTGSYAVSVTDADGRVATAVRNATIAFGTPP